MPCWGVGMEPAMLLHHISNFLPKWNFIIMLYQQFWITLRKNVNLFASWLTLHHPDSPGYWEDFRPWLHVHKNLQRCQFHWELRHFTLTSEHLSSAIFKFSITVSSSNLKLPVTHCPPWAVTDPGLGYLASPPTWFHFLTLFQRPQQSQFLLATR